MGRQPLFSEILEGKLRNEPRAMPLNMSSSREFDTDPAHLAYLMSQVQKLETPHNRAAKAYPQTPPRPVTPYLLTEPQSKAQSYFQSWDEPLSPRFTRVELKAAFRRLAKKLHPDLSLRSGHEFMELKKSYEILKEVPKR